MTETPTSRAPQTFDEFMSMFFGPRPENMCDCPPGQCQSDEGMDPLESMILGVLAGDEAPIEDDEITEFEKREAVSNLGRIIEGLTIVTHLHAQLVTKVVEG